jgi:hypothetical protein
MHQTSKVHDIFRNLRHITTKTTSSIKVTQEPAPIQIYINYGSTLVVLCYNSTYFSNKMQKVKHATTRNKWSVCWRDTVSAVRRHTNGYELCPSSSRFILKLIWVGVSSKTCKDKNIHEARAFNFTYRYIDDVLFINNSRLA